MSRDSWLLVAGVTAAVLAGCATVDDYAVTQPLAQVLADPITVVVGEIVEELPTDTPGEKMPGPEIAQTLRSCIEETLPGWGPSRTPRQLLDMLVGRGAETIVLEQAGGARYEVRGSMLEFEFGKRRWWRLWTRKIKLTVALRLVDLGTGSTIFSGNYALVDWVNPGQHGREVIQKLADRFCGELHDQRRARAGGR